MGTAGARGETGEGGRGTSLRVTYSPPAAPPHPPTLAREDSNNSVCLRLQLKTPIITATGMVSTCQFSTELKSQLKGREPEWTNPKSSTGNCMNCAKMQ